jgi:hypothetical protein
MSEESEPIETGEPIAPLAELDQDVSAQFLQGVRKKIYRRTAANQVVAFSWNLPKVILLELLMLVVHMVSGPDKEKAKS